MDCCLVWPARQPRSKAGLEAWKAERAAALLEAQACPPAAQQQYLVQVENNSASLSVVTASWSNIAVSTQVSQKDAAHEDGTKKTLARFGRLMGSVAAARASMLSFFA